MFLSFLICFSLSAYALSATELTSEQSAFSKKIAGVLQSGDATEYKKIIHSNCPIDESKISDATKNLWTKRYQVRFKTVNEAFDLSKFKFKVPPEYVLEFQAWKKVTDPKLIKMLKGATEIESIKAFPIAKENAVLKILEWPCFESI